MKIEETLLFDLPIESCRIAFPLGLNHFVKHDGIFKLPSDFVFREKQILNGIVYPMEKLKLSEWKRRHVVQPEAERLALIMGIAEFHELC